MSEHPVEGWAVADGAWHYLVGWRYSGATSLCGEWSVGPGPGLLLRGDWTLSGTKCERCVEWQRGRRRG